MELAAAVLEDGENSRVVAEVIGFVGSDHGGEAVEDGVVHVEDAGFLGELGTVPVVVRRENGRHGSAIDAENEGLRGGKGDEERRREKEEKERENRGGDLERLDRC